MNPEEILDELLAGTDFDHALAVVRSDPRLVPALFRASAFCENERDFYGYKARQLLKALIT